MKKKLLAAVIILALVAVMMVGCEGAEGIEGLRGLEGLRGEQGPQGEAGPQGEVGPAGPSGASGSQGEPGSQGETGPAGPEGSAGSKGATGATGPAGSDADCDALEARVDELEARIDALENPTPTIDGVISPCEWTCATHIPVVEGMGTASVIAYADYLYVLLDIVDSNDARTDYEGERGNDQVSINVNPTAGEGNWGFPYDLIFETSALSEEDGGHHQLPWNPKVNSGTLDGWATRWFPNDAQEDLPSDLESATTYSGGKRITEWKLPLSAISVSAGDTLKVGGAIDVGDGNSYVYPIGLDWNNPGTFVDVLVR